jgi:hypothetical protein
MLNPLASSSAVLTQQDEQELGVATWWTLAQAPLDAAILPAVRDSPHRSYRLQVT